MSKQKFQEGDRVVISKKFKDRYNCITGVGTVIDIDRTVAGDVLIPVDDIHSIHTPSTRKMYFVQWDDKSFVGPYYSYELEKYGESFKYQLDDQVSITDEAKQWIKEHTPKGAYFDVRLNDDYFVVTDRKHKDNGRTVYYLDGIYEIGFYSEDLIPFVSPEREVPIPPVVHFEENPITFHTDLQPGHTEISDTGAFKWVVDNPTLESVKEKLDYTDECEERRKKWVDICNDYLYEFCQRHGYHYDPFGWIGGEEGKIIEINDMFVTMDNIRYDVDNNIDPEWFATWYWKSVDVHELTGENYMNYENFCKGCPDVWTEDRMESIRKSKKRIEDAKKALEKEIENIKHNKKYF